MMFLPQTQTPTTLDHWLSHVLEQTSSAGAEQLYALIDLASSQFPILNTLQLHSAQVPFTLLLEENHGREIAESGPALVQINMADGAQKKLLRDLLHAIEGEPRCMLLLPAPPTTFRQLQARLYLATQVELGEGGEMRFMLRYYDPRCFMTALNHLEQAAQKLLLEPVRQWHWLNRDNCPCLLEQPGDIAAWPDWPHPALHLSEPAIAYISAWHQAELWRQRYRLSPADLKQADQEALMQLLLSAQLAADQADMLSEPQRVAFIRDYLSSAVHD